MNHAMVDAERVRPTSARTRSSRRDESAGSGKPGCGNNPGRFSFFLLLPVLLFLPLLSHGEDADTLSSDPHESPVIYTGADSGDELTGLHLALRGGYTANIWRPAGLEPYEVRDYGRHLFYAEIALLHPLLQFGEAFDIINVPSLRLETNFGYSSSSSGRFYEVIPDVVELVPYVRTSSWVTFFNALSFRYNVERFDATLNNPTAGSDSTLYVTNEMRDIEVGLIYDLPHEDIAVEVGYYYSEINWPEVHRIVQWFVERPRVQEWGVSMHGVYGAMHLTGPPGRFGLNIQAVLRVGQAVGGDLRARFEHELAQDWSIGVRADAGLRYIADFNHEYAEFIHENNRDNSYDARFRINLYTVFVIL